MAEHSHSAGIKINTRAMIGDFDSLFNCPAGINFNPRVVSGYR